MLFNTFFLDLDDTVYPATAGLWGQIASRIDQYMIERVKIPEEGIAELRERLFHMYGTTLRGLSIEYGINEREYLQFVHDIPVTQYIQPDPLLKQVLEAIPQRSVILTNADQNHARRVLKAVGIEDQISQIIDILDISPYCKPQPEAFKKALLLANENDPHKIAFFDDNLTNLKAAREMGFYTVRVGSQESGPEYHSSIQFLRDLPELFNHKAPRENFHA